MTIYNVMPVMRQHLWPQIRANLEHAHAAGVNLVWFPIMFVGETLSPETAALFAPKWIKPMHMYWTGIGTIFAQKTNFCLSQIERLKEPGYLFFGSDDNLIPPSLWQHWLKADSFSGHRPIVVTSCRRGQSKAKSGYEPTDLIAHPDNMRISRVTGEQALIPTSLMKGRRLADHNCCDGQLIEELHKAVPERFCYLPEVFIPFNALEPGRWEEDKLQETLNA